MQHRTVPGHMDHGIYIDLEPVRSWVEKVVESGRLTEICLTAATLTILGWSVFAFHKALQNYQVVGPSFF